jgi:hypothetical protein
MYAAITWHYVLPVCSKCKSLSLAKLLMLKGIVRATPDLAHSIAAHRHVLL